MTVREVWKGIRGYPDYMISDKGRVLSSHKGIVRLLKPLPRGDYFVACLYDGKTSYRHSIHTLVIEAFGSPHCTGMYVNHKNGNKTDNRFSNLEWVTASENQKHACRMGLKATGTRHHSAKLTEPQVLNIRSLFERGHKQAEIARMYSVSTSVIWSIVHNRTWTYI